VQAPIMELLSANPFHTLRSIQVALTPLAASLATIHRAVRGCGRSYVKVSWRTPPRDMGPELMAFFAEFRQLVDRGTPIIALDETGFLTTQLPLYGYGTRGQRLRIARRHPRRYKASCIAAITQRGLVALETFDGNINGPRFLAFVRTAFAACPDSVAVLDNIAFHKSAAVRAAAEEYGVRLMFTPPYSPECNPVEHFFSVLKRSVRDSLLRSTVSSSEEFRLLVNKVVHRVAASHTFGPYFGPRLRETSPGVIWSPDGA
jgi:transposase